MKAMIFAAGLGTRLKPLTSTMPKAMIPVNGRPLLQILIDKLKSQGFTEIVINVHHFANQIVDFIEENNNFGINIKISDESDKLLDTGGGLKKAFPLFDISNDECILVHNVDVLNNANLHSFATLNTPKIVPFHGENKKVGAVLLVSRRISSRYLLFDDNNFLVGWIEESTGKTISPYDNLDVSSCHKYAFSGIHIFTKEAFDLMADWESPFGIINFYLSICHNVPIQCVVDENLKLLDVGKQDTLSKAENFLMEIS